MHERGTVVAAADPFGNTPRRPYLIISGRTHPFAGTQYIALGISTKEYAESQPLVDAFETGTLTQESYVSPWAVVSLMNIDVDRAVARVTEEATDTAATKMTQYVLK